MKTLAKGASVVVLAALCAPLHAQQTFTQDDIIGKIAGCMRETAPKDWRQMVFTLDQENPDSEDPGKIVASHKAAGKADKAMHEIKPCRRPDWVSKAVQRFRELQDEKTRGWTGITLTFERDGHYSINYRYPKK
jgi:hypothetical protein